MKIITYNLNRIYLKKFLVILKKYNKEKPLSLSRRRLSHTFYIKVCIASFIGIFRLFFCLCALRCMCANKIATSAIAIVVTSEIKPAIIKCVFSIHVLNNAYCCVNNRKIINKWMSV